MKTIIMGHLGDLIDFIVPAVQCLPLRLPLLELAVSFLLFFFEKHYNYEPIPHDS